MHAFPMLCPVNGCLGFSRNSAKKCTLLATDADHAGLVLWNPWKRASNLTPGVCAFGSGWTYVWGALSLLMTLIPTFRDFRLLNVIAIAGTGFTAVYIWVASAVHGYPAGAANLAPYNIQVCSSLLHVPRHMLPRAGAAVLRAPVAVTH